MVSMSLATIGWAAWWLALIAVKLAPSKGAALVVGATAVSVPFAFLGLLLAAVTLRARRTWILFVMVPLFANGSLLVMPWLASEMLPRE
jgi:hypothetical protein